jgi:large conductance mechanosensitive channel
MTILDEFKKFLLRGNVIDLAVAVVIGVAFGAVVTSLVQDLITPLLAIPGDTDFSDLTFTINDSTFFYGRFINALISFILIAAAVFFLVVKPVNTLVERSRTDPVPADPTTRKCPECLSEIPIAAKRCAHCASPVSTTP